MTLQGVQQASRRFPEPIAIDYLSRLERGTLMPSVPKLATLAHVYQRPLQEFVDLYELEHLKALIPEQEGDFWHFRTLCNDYRAAGDYWRAAGAMLRGLDVARAMENIDEIAQALTTVGISLNNLGRYHGAQRFSEQALRIVRDDRIRGYALHTCAMAHYHLDNLMLAELLCEKAGRYVHLDPALRLNVPALFAAIQSDRGDYQQAAAVELELMSAYEKAGDIENVIRAQYSAGSNLAMTSRIEEGLSLLRDSMARAAELGDPRLRAYSALYYGRSLYRVARYEEAISSLRSAFLIARDRDMSEQAFQAAFYLWKLSDERGFPIEGNWLDEARQYRMDVDIRDEVTTEFDAWLAQDRKRPRPGRKPKEIM